MIEYLHSLFILFIFSNSVSGPRAQNAIEFITTYSYMLLIISLAIAVLFLFFSIPKAVIPFQCSFYTGFACTDVELLERAGGASLVVVATDTQPGTVNVSAFNAVVNNQQSAQGFCEPPQVSDGQLLYCVANFTFKPYITNIYYGTFSMRANYCTSGTFNLSTVSCAAPGNFIFGGSLRVQPSNILGTINSIINSSGMTTFYVPITLENNLPATSAMPFQQRVLFVPSNSVYNKYERANLGNIRFFYDSRELDSWCEMNCTSSYSSNAVFWVKLPFQFPPNSNVVLDMEFLPNSINYDGVYAGEAPNQSTYYGQYDNGQNVFDFYDNFKGRSLSSKWTGSTNNGGTITVANGIQLSCAGTCGSSFGNASIIANWSIASYANNFIVEALMNIHGTSPAGTANALINLNMQGGESVDPGNILDVQPGSLPYDAYYGMSESCRSITCTTFEYYDWAGMVAAGPSDSGSATKYNVLDQQVFQTTGYFTWDPMSYPGLVASFSNSITLAGTGYISPTFGVQGIGVGTSELNIGWVRVRGYPPGGVMPTVVVGNTLLRIT